MALSNSMQSLPDECLAYIFSFLPMKVLLFRVRIICKNFHEIIVGCKSPIDDHNQEKSTCQIRNQKIKVKFRYSNPNRLRSLWQCIRKGYFVDSVSELVISARKENILETLLDKNDFFAKYLSNLQNLKLQSYQFEDEDLSELFTLENSKYLRKLTKLDLSYNSLGVRTMQKIARCENLSNLTSLKLDYNGIEGQCLELIQSPHLTKLTHLDLQSNYIQAKNWKLEFGLKNLEEFVIGNNEIDEDAFDVIFNSEKQLFSNLKTLNVSDSLLNENAFKIMKKCDSVPTLTTLDLSYHEIDENMMTLISESKCLANLQKLEMINCSITGKGFAKLTTSKFLSNLEDLVVESNNINSEGFVYFGSQSYTLKNLKVLDLLSNDLDLDCYEYILKEPSLKGLQKLICDTLSEKEAKYILEHQENLVEITNLVFYSYSEAIDNSLKYLGMLNLPKLKYLRCGTGGATDGLVSFMENCTFGNIEVLDIGNFNTTDNPESLNQAISLMVSNRNFSKLENFSLNKLSSECISLLLDNMEDGKVLSKLTALSISGITTREFDVLITHPNISRLKMLALMEAELIDESIENLVKCPNLLNLTYLDLIGTQISSYASNLISKSNNMPNLQDLFGTFVEKHFHEETNLPMLKHVYISGTTNDRYEDDIDSSSESNSEGY